ncbi:MAG: hypothetical protein ACK4SJ_11200 [Sphingorhabdus sp.]
MSGVFAASEVSGLNPAGTAVETTGGGTFRAAYSRAAGASNSATNFYTAVLNDPLTDLWVRWTANSSWDSDASGEIFRARSSAGVNVCRISLTSNGSVAQLQFWNGSGWSNLGAAFNLSTGYGSGLHEFALRIVTGATGTVALFINGAPIASGSMGAGTVNVKDFIIGTADDTLPVNISEVAVLAGGASIIGSAVETEAPTADATDLGGTGTFADIDEAVLTDADFITFAAAGDRRSFTSPARTGTLELVHGVGVAARARRDAGGPQNMRFYLKIGGVRYYSPTYALALGYSAYQYVWSQNPATSAAWTAADASAATLEWGIEAVA